MALRALLLLGLARQTRQQGKEEDPNILGRIELETTQVEPVNVRAGPRWQCSAIASASVSPRASEPLRRAEDVEEKST